MPKAKCKAKHLGPEAEANLKERKRIHQLQRRRRRRQEKRQEQSSECYTEEEVLESATGSKAPDDHHDQIEEVLESATGSIVPDDHHDQIEEVLESATGSIVPDDHHDPIEKRSKIKEHMFQWPVHEHQEKRTARKPSRVEVLEQRLADVQGEYANLQKRHRLCTHENTSPVVSQRVAGIVENSVLSDTYSHHQSQLDDIDVLQVQLSRGTFSNMELLKLNDKLVYYMYRDVEMKFVKIYKNQANTALLEYRILSANVGVPFIVRPVGVYYDWNYYRGNPMLVYSISSDYDKYRTVAMELSRGTLSKECWFGICLSLALALRELHQNGYIHNSIFLENIHVVCSIPDVSCCLDDFSKSCAIQTARPLTARQVQELEGVRYSVAPELLRRSASPSMKTDVFAFGQVLVTISIKRNLLRTFLNVGNSCKCERASDRPSMHEVCQQLISLGKHNGYRINKLALP